MRTASALLVLHSAAGMRPGCSWALTGVRAKASKGEHRRSIGRQRGEPRSQRTLLSAVSQEVSAEAIATSLLSLLPPV